MSLWIINAVKNMSLFLQLSPKNLLRDYIKWGPYFGVSNRVSILLRRQSCLDKQPKQSLNSWPNNSPFVFVNKNEAAHTKITTKACNKSAIISLNNKSYETNLLRIAKKGERKSSTALHVRINSTWSEKKSWCASIFVPILRAHLCCLSRELLHSRKENYYTKWPSWV
jgi:hypothetical protein